MPHGFGVVPFKPPSPRRATEVMLGVEIGGTIESDGTLPLRCAADALDAARETWAAACTVHAEALGKVNALHTEASALLRSRAFFRDARQRTLRACDAALAEIRVEQKELEGKIARATVPPRARDDFAGAVMAGEIRSFLRGLNDVERMSALERAIGAGNAEIMAAALHQPVLAGLTKERSDLLMARWRKVRCPDELERLALLQQTAEKVAAAGQRLEQRYSEGYDHAVLDRLEASSKAA